MKKNWITIFILFLLTVNAALTTTLLVNSKTKDKKVIKFKKTEHSGTHSEGPGRFELHIAKKLEMTSHQKQQLKEFSKEFHKKKKANHFMMSRLKSNFILLSSDSSTKPEDLKVISDSLGFALTNNILLEHDHFRNIKSICTENQARLLDSLGKRKFYNKKFERRNNEYRRRHKHSGDLSNNHRKIRENENK